MTNKKPLCTLQDGYLQARDKQGDVEAWSILFHREVLRLMAKENKGPQALHRALNKDVWLYFTRKNNSPPVRIFIEVRAHTTAEKIKKRWKEISAWRRLLVECQGDGEAIGPKRFFTELEILEENLKKDYPKTFYSELAKILNRSLERKLRQGDHFGPLHAVHLLRTMQPRKKDHEEWIADALESIKRKQLPSWASGTLAYTRPITPQNVRDRLKTWSTKHPPRATRNK
jgi:hypothetical protein